MKQAETWLLHLLLGVLMALPVFIFFPQYMVHCVLFISGFALGRERRDHEIKARLPARDWWKHWNILTWSKDGKMDLITFILPGFILWLLTL